MVGYEMSHSEIGGLLEIYICVVPMFPILIEFWRNA